MKRLTSLMSAACFLLMIVTALQAGQNSAAKIRIDLNTSTTGNQNLNSIGCPGTGVYVRVDIYVVDASNLDTYEFDLNFPSTDLTYVQATEDQPLTFESNILKANGGTTIGWTVYTADPGVINIANTLTGNDESEAPEGEGLLGQIVFLTTVDCPGDLTFGDVTFYDNNGVTDECADKGDASLPVQLSSMIATSVNGQGVTLNWRTESEIDCAGFQIWRSEETKDDFKQISTTLIPGQGNSSTAFEYTYTDITAQDGVIYWYKIIEVAVDGTQTVFGPISVEGAAAIPTEFALSQNYPNPFNPETNIKYQLPNKEHVQITIYNIKGEKVLELLNRDQEAGYYDIIWNGKDADQTPVSTGVYMIMLQAGNFQSIIKAMMLR